MRATVPVCLMLALGLGCAHGSGVSVSGLPVKRVVIYRNGVGYFEREGRVRDDRVHFHVRPTHIDDFLATLSVMEEGGSSVRSASFPMQVQPREGDTPNARPLETVTLHLDGRAHELTVGYIAEQPVWRPSYRLVLEKGQLALQAWGIVQNLSGEDWKDVRMSLVAGAPIAFQSTLAQPVTPPRPVVSDSGELISAVPRGETSLGQDSPAAQPPAPRPATPSLDSQSQAEGADGDAMELSTQLSDKLSNTKERSRGAPKGSVGARPPSKTAAPAVHGVPSTLPSNSTRALLASAAVTAGTTRYDLPQEVTVPDQSATLVLLLAQSVPGEAVHMFAPDPGVPDSASHPFRVARFKNVTPGLLERGPLAVLESGAFLGQGVLEPLSAGGEATVPFALDRGVAVDSDRSSRAVGARVAQIEAGNLFIERDQVLETKYRLRNGGPVAIKVVVRHPRVDGMKLHDPPAGTEDQVGKGTALAPVQVKGRGTAELRLEERRPYTMQADWMTPEADEAVQALRRDPSADRGLVSALTEAWEVRRSLERDGQEREKLNGEKAILQSGSAEARENLESLQRNPAKGVVQLREKLSARLLQMDSRLAEINKRLVELELRIGEATVRFREKVRELKLERPAST